MKKQKNEPVMTLGQHLRKERELRGIDLDEVSRVTRVRVAYLQCLEEDRLAELPGDVYSRGYIRAYARFLGIEADRCVDLYRSQSLDHSQTPVAAFDPSYGKSLGGMPMRSLPGLADGGIDSPVPAAAPDSKAMGSSRSAGRSRIGLALAIVMLIFGALLITGVYYVNRSADPAPDSNIKPPAAQNDKNADFFLDS